MELKVKPSLSDPEQVDFERSRIITVPNALSMLRIAGVPLFVWLIVGPAAYEWAAVVLMVSGFTDWLDGYLARRLSQTSRLGQFLDPLADRLYIFASLVALLVSSITPIWLVAAIVVRDVLLLCTGPILFRRGYRSLAVNFVGKAGTMGLLIAIPMLLLGASQVPLHAAIAIAAWAFALWGVALYWVAAALYFTQLLQIMRGTLPSALGSSNG
ncbi:MAG: CDP-diacylglycerol--glycerol-3-phosphate 3-phosphatidyltransferase [Acidimicrobiales bacterium]|nr:MAG: CDP-diacylglycerol--glycerol-3-phosphate 3-phosphatidyltransferase [Acidimicrobiales bacterium]